MTPEQAAEIKTGDVLFTASEFDGWHSIRRHVVISAGPLRVRVDGDMQCADLVRKKIPAGPYRLTPEQAIACLIERMKYRVDLARNALTTAEEKLAAAEACQDWQIRASRSERAKP